MFYRFLSTTKNLLGKMYVDGAILSKSHNIALNCDASQFTPNICLGMKIFAHHHSPPYKNIEYGYMILYYYWIVG